MSAPELIYLQWIEDESAKFMPEGVTWCADRIECDDVEYVRADKAAAEIEALREDAERYRWLSKRVVITDGSTPGLMVITVVDDGVETTNEFLDEFTEPAIAAIESQRIGNGESS
jgi:hypothetical protein